MIVFICGPFRAPTSWEVEQNVRRAEEVALEVWRMGHVAICPHANSRYFDKQGPDSVWLAGYLEVLRRCDAVQLVYGWWESAGAQAEVDLAHAEGIPVYATLADLAKSKAA